MGDRLMWIILISHPWIDMDGGSRQTRNIVQQEVAKMSTPGEN